MSRLNIPLSTSLGTRPSTRSRRVLLLGLFWFLTIVLSVILSEAWFSRDTLSAHAPEGTKTIIHLTPSKLAWTKISEDFKNIPLVSGRPISFNNIFSFKTSEIAIFVSEDNSLSVAIRAKDKNIRFDFLNSFNITTQKLGKNKWLLSSKPLPFSTKNKTNWHLLSAMPGNIGFFSSGGFTGHITQTSKGYQITIPELKTKNPYLPKLPESTLVAALIQPEQEFYLEKIIDRFELILDPIGILKISEFIKKITENSTTIVFSEPSEQSGTINFLIKTGLNGADLSQTMQTIAAFQNPKLNFLTLPDNSKVQEIVINPQNIEFQTLWINGLESKAVNTAFGQIFAIETQNGSLISSSSQFLQDFIQRQEEKVVNSCGSTKKVILIKPKIFGNIVQNEKFSFSEPGLLKLLEIFDEISLSSGKIDFCY